MRSRARVLALLLGAIGVCAVGGARADDEDLAGTLRKLLSKGLAAYDREDVEETMRYVHAKSPGYDETKAKLTEQFVLRDLSIQLVDFRFIGHDDEFAVARAHIKTVGLGGEPFMDNVTDMLTLFHQENGQWKFWSNHVIGVETLE
jgi:hypothetical protein